MARLLMAIVVVFFCCHSTKIIVNFYEAFQVTKDGGFTLYMNVIFVNWGPNNVSSLQTEQANKIFIHLKKLT